MTRARILLADDHRIVAEGLKSILAAEYELVGVVENGQEMLEAARTLNPDVIVADITMPLMNGIEALDAIRKEGLETPVVFLTMHHDVAYASLALEAGAAGYVLKHSAPDELVRAVHAVLEGGTFVSPSLASELFHSSKARPDDKAQRVMALSPRQREILRQLAGGRSAKEVAKALDISSRTVEFHKYKMMDALGLKNSAELIRFAIQQGIAQG